MKINLLEEIDEFGFANVPDFIGEEKIVELISSLSKISGRFKNKRPDAVYGVRNLLNLSAETRILTESSEVKSLVENILGENARAVRAIFFDKTPEANWKVPWHQDLTIAVKEKRDTEGYTAWTRKADIQHVQPPVSILENMLAVRIHLDDNDETNGVLKVIPKSHKSGRLSAEDIQNLKTNENVKICRTKRGEAFLMRPLLVHSSSAGTRPTHRRVIHIEYAAENLPNNLEWYGS